MISSAALKQLTPQQRADVILGQARSELSDRLWRAALGGEDLRGDAASPTRAAPTASGLDVLLAMLTERAATPTALPPSAAPAVGTPADLLAEVDAGDRVDTGTPASASASPTGLGPNARYLPTLEQAAARTGIPAPALAAIVHAEAGKGADGSWQLYSRNPRSSAAGLGQFLSGTWEGMAERKGTWLNDVARSKGWLDGHGRIVPAARSSLLSLRYDAAASINTIADYARQNLDGLRRPGFAVAGDAAGIAKGAYLGHHLGLGDAIRFMKGGLDPSRARVLLGAQIGSSKAGQQIAAAGDATAAHRNWFLNYVDRNVRPERFAA